MPNKIIYDNGNALNVNHINPYLIDTKDIFVYSRKEPLCDVPTIGVGNKPIDGGYYLFTKEEMEAFLKSEPMAKKYFHEWYGAKEFIHNQPRYCLWLGDCSPHELMQMPLCRKRVESVRQYRLHRTSAPTRKLAEKPTRFHVENFPKGSYIVIPQVSSQRRRYIPMGYMHKGVICSDKVRIMENGTLYHFGVLESNVHMAWMRVISCRLKSDYSYTVNDVYNCFPWPTPTESQKKRIEQTAQAILDVRAKYPDSSLADLYDPTTMPYDLLEAHRNNDRAVMAAYGFSTKLTESECEAKLFELYSKLAKV